MIYRRIRVGLCEYKKRFYRVVLVREDVSVYELGVILGTALGAEFEHMFLFKAGKETFCDPSWIDSDNEYSYYDKNLKDLGTKFMFIYDTGDYWDFEVTVYEKEYDIDSLDIAFLEDGKGQGIWEDNKYNLIRYFDGEIASDEKEDEEKGIAYPWNYEIEKFSDFDTAFDMEFEKEGFADIVEENIYYLDEARDKVSRYLPDKYDEDDDDTDVDLMSSYDAAFDRVCEYIASYQIMTDDEVKDLFDDLCENLGEEEAMRKIVSVVKDELDEYIDNNEMLKNHSYFTKLYDIDDETYS